MRKLTRLLLAAGASALLLAGTPIAAQAEPHPVQEAASPFAADGKFHIYRDAGYKNECAASSGNVSDYRNLGCNDQVSSVINSGYPGNFDDVWMYKDAGYTGSRRGIYNGVGIIDLQWFAYDDGAPMNDTMSSHKWTNLP
ncbi:hypothetical protein NGF19_29275 [Streptomyces sp. RY43-2]|uniref:Secreted protein n=1 Tax=Streptomyces macrolidinus TaxID=2952607 RepID=A0ABT0ZML5_9ACTN|nr:hypothetical protein [Streptomyces macrolidinus]MCN9244824.1 hypothetical protein [Streptomyces macrolidinus]